MVCSQFNSGKFIAISKHKMGSLGLVLSSHIISLFYFSAKTVNKTYNVKLTPNRKKCPVSKKVKQYLPFN